MGPGPIRGLGEDILFAIPTAETCVVAARPRETASHRRAVRRLVLLFFVSGATSLIYESLWARQLYLVVGTAQLAISIVLAAFMTGLALGGLVAARLGRRVQRPLRVFAGLEGFVALYALGFGFLLEPATRLYLSLSSALPPHSAALLTSQFLVLGALLLPPTLCMGATLPLLARFASRDGRDAGSTVGRLYGVNTLGAVVGTAAAGFILLPQFGLTVTTGCAAAANGLVAVTALWLARRSAPARPARARTPARALEPAVNLAPLLAISAIGGFASLVCEVAWFRLLTLVLGGSAYSFTIMLLAFLLGIGVGGWAGGRAADRSLAAGGRVRVLLHLGGLQLGVAIACWGALFAYGELPYAFVSLVGWIGDTAPIYLFAGKLVLALSVMLVPALLMGASFPFLVRAAVDGATGLERPVGLLYGANTLGAIAGASVGGLILLPTLEMRGAVLAAASMNLVAVAVALVAARPRWLRGLRIAALPAAVAGGIAAMHVFEPPWDPMLMSSGLYQYAARLEHKTREELLAFAVRPFDLVFYEEGRSSVVTVARARRDGNIWLANNGKIDASSKGDLDTQVLLAHLPAILRPQSERALVIGLASGVTAGSLLLDDRLKSLDIAEIEPAVVRASRAFDGINNRPLDDPRVRLYLNDARNHLLRSPDGYYDLVTSEPSNPWISGVSNLFTREFFLLGKRKLAPDGVWAQWLHLYGMQPDDLRSLLATFADAYSYVGVFRIDDSDLLLVGGDSPLNLHVARIDDYVGKNRGVVEDLNRVRFERAEDIVGLYQFDREALLRLAGDVELNTDDNLRIEYSAPLSLHKETSMRNVAMLERAAEIPYGAVSPDRLAKLARVYAERDTGWKRALATLRSAVELRPDDSGLESLYRQTLARAERSPMLSAN